MTSDSFLKIKSRYSDPSSFLETVGSTSTQDGSQVSRKQLYPPKSSSSHLPVAPEGDRGTESTLSRNDGRLGTATQPCKQTINVVVFGESVFDNGAVVNLIARREVASISSDFHGRILQSTRYDISFDDANFSVFDTVGLDAPTIGVNLYPKILEKAYEFVVKLNAAGGIHLLLFVTHSARMTSTVQSNHLLFYNVIGQTNVPVALVFTGLESEAKMEDWWTRNKTDIERSGIKHDSHACITVVQADGPCENPKYAESQKKIRELLKRCSHQTSAFLLEPRVWFNHIGTGLQDFIHKHRKPVRSDVAKALLTRCKLEPEAVGTFLDMMDHGDAPPRGRDGGGALQMASLARTEDQVEVAVHSRPDTTTLIRAFDVMKKWEDEAQNRALIAGEVNPRTANKLEQSSKTDELINGTRSESSFPRDLTGHVAKFSDFPVASGSYGDIYRGNLTMSGRTTDVAIKTYKMYLQHDEHLDKRTKRFRREILVWLKLEHLNVLPLLGTIKDLSMHPDIPAMVCPWVENGALSTYLEQNNDLTVAKRFVLINDVAHGLQYLHSQHVVHGDLSGSNVLVRADGSACIADFGLSTLLTEIGGSIYASTRQTRGTVRWMAPELFYFDISPETTIPTTQSDVYSFGSIMLRILTRKIPYHEFSRDEQVIFAIAKGVKPKRPNDKVVTDDRWKFIEWCWSPLDAAKRRPSSDAIVELTMKELAKTMAAY